MSTNCYRSQVWGHSPEATAALGGEPVEVPDACLLFDTISRCNHACDPNCHWRYEGARLRDRPQDDTGRLVSLFAVRDIKAGEELTLDYG